jgi:hypothetical protein
VNFDYDTPGSITITTDGDDLEEAMKTMAIKPGEDNGEDINIEISATAIESNPSESGANEVLKLTATTRFKANADGYEDTLISIGASGIGL